MNDDTIIIDHTHPRYRAKWNRLGSGRFNGAYYYSEEIVRNIIPNIETDRNWITIDAQTAVDHSVVFIHNNERPQAYNWLKRYKDLILVCGIPETCTKVAHLGTPIYLPLSVDVETVAKYKRPKTKEVAYVGRPVKREGINFSPYVAYLEGMPRHKLLRKMAEYKSIFAVGRCAIEGLILDCEILPYDKRFPDVSRWKILDNKEAVVILQKELDAIDLHR